LDFTFILGWQQGDQTAQFFAHWATLGYFSRQLRLLFERNSPKMTVFWATFYSRESLHFYLNKDF
jgi:hypothetical protein